MGAFSHPNDRRDKPASFGQIAFVFDKIEKLLIFERREKRKDFVPILRGVLSGVNSPLIIQAKPDYKIKISHNQR